MDPRDEPCVCMTLRAATRSVTAAYDRAFRPRGLTTTQFATLCKIYNAGDVEHSALADLLEMDRTTLTRTLAPLKRMGLVEETRGADRRRRVFRLTAAGEEKRSECMPLWDETQTRAMSRLDAADWERLQQLLDKIAHPGPRDDSPCR